MARAAASTFEQRLARIENQGASGKGAYRKDNLIQETKKKRRLHWDMVAFGGVAGGIAGTLFAMNVGLLVLMSLDVMTIYQMVMGNYMMAVFIAGVAIAPVGFVMSQIFARSNPRGWQFWIGYLGGVLAANYADLQTYYYILMNPAA